jgi:hypothetical protein
MTNVIPFDAELDEDMVENLIFEHEGDIGAMAKAIHVRSDRLRAFCLASARLRKAQDEIYELCVDESIGVLRRLLKSESMQNQFYAAKEWLRSNAGKRRGFGQDGFQPSIEVKAGSHTIAIKWLDPDTTPEPKTIEGDLG